ncbi:WXG100 family type VII secretion target (plasmid) [Streptomyces sp. NBC_01471]|uniref:WXG100 family type VII secretion target n=1 Tax=Streptomyces sp. NBC_01471 TaxID=2903879 RepID=UPI002F90AF3B
MADVDGTPIWVGSGLQGAGAWMNGMATQAADDLDQLRKLLSPLQEAWTRSQAADYYQGLQTEWNVAAEGVFGPDGVLGRIAQAMHVNWNNYEEAEWSNISTWKH